MDAAHSHHSHTRRLSMPAVVGLYLGIFAVAFTIAAAVTLVSKVNLYRSVGVTFGTVYAFGALRRPWWLFYVMRRYRWIAEMDDRSVRILFSALAVLLIGAGLFWPE